MVGNRCGTRTVTRKNGRCNDRFTQPRPTYSTCLRPRRLISVIETSCASPIRDKHHHHHHHHHHHRHSSKSFCLHAITFLTYFQFHIYDFRIPTAATPADNAMLGTTTYGNVKLDGGSHENKADDDWHLTGGDGYTQDDFRSKPPSNMKRRSWYAKLLGPVLSILHLLFMTDYSTNIYYPILHIRQLQSVANRLKK